MASSRIVISIFPFLICIIFLLFVEIQIQSLKSNNNIKRQWKYSNSLGAIDIESTNQQKNAEEKYFPVVIYNRIAKTGSTTFTHHVYSLTGKNTFYVAHVNITKNSLKMSLSDQYDMVKNISLWKEKQPAFYHGHFAYLSFDQFGIQNPLYINVLREPLDRLVSHYYFLRYGDDFRKGLKRVKDGDTTTFDECVAAGKPDCNPNKLWFQIPQLCGQKAECWKPGSQWALAEAKRNLMNNYFLVGVTEEMEDFIVILEAAVPVMFKGLTESFREGRKSNVRKTLHKVMPSNETIAHMKATKMYRMERELYDSALKQFHFIKQYTTEEAFGVLRPFSKRYRYEKFYGPNGRI